jgi:hypothetical protein
VGRAARDQTIWPHLRRLTLRALACDKCLSATLPKGKARLFAARNVQVVYLSSSEMSECVENLYVD